jgi:hypothetical protein
MAIELGAALVSRRCGFDVKRKTVFRLAKSWYPILHELMASLPNARLPVAAPQALARRRLAGVGGHPGTCAGKRANAHKVRVELSLHPRCA